MFTLQLASNKKLSKFDENLVIPGASAHIVNINAERFAETTLTK